VPINPEDPSSWIGIDFVFTEVSAQLTQQQKLWEEADARLRLILGVISIVFAVTLGLIPRGTVTVPASDGRLLNEPMYLPFFVGTLAILGLCLFGLAGFIVVVAYWPRNFSWPPRPESIREYVTTDEREIKLTVLDTMLDAYEANAVWVGRKFLAFRWALVLAGIATGLLGASVIIDLAQLTRAFS
jgi:hypothetical protein